MTPADYQELAASLARSGVRSISGDLLLDDSWFDAQRLGAEWANDDEGEPFAAQISALTIAADEHYNVGSVQVTVKAGARSGAPVQVTIDPPNQYVTVVNSAVTGQGAALKVERAHGSNRIEVTGSLGAGSGYQQWSSVWEPTGLVADVFRQALAAQGIRLMGQIRLGAVTPPGTQVLAEHRSMPLGELLRPLLKQSNNGIAEVLLKAMGRQTANQGTAKAGIAAVAGFLRSQGLDDEQLRQFDGSGLSRRNLISTQLFSDVLIKAHQGDRLNGGTLRNRLKGTAAQNNLHAKTGSMGAVSSLTGYVTNSQGKLLAFSMLSNNFLTPEGRIKRLEDAMVQALLVSND
jgi:D-alanyl-D-alanine carboxypeptidase/D-alanyl-D-alanine-endopeptidase (penicillin-binding protein 4)